MTDLLGDPLARHRNYSHLKKDYSSSSASVTVCFRCFRTQIAAVPTGTSRSHSSLRKRCLEERKCDTCLKTSVNCLSPTRRSDSGETGSACRLFVLQVELRTNWVTHTHSWWHHGKDKYSGWIFQTSTTRWRPNTPEQLLTEIQDAASHQQHSGLQTISVTGNIFNLQKGTFVEEHLNFL